MATDYDEVRSDVKESQDRSLEALQSANAPDARSVVTELDEADALDEGLTPGGEIVAEELIVQVIPQAAAIPVSSSGTGPNSHVKATAAPTASSAKARPASTGRSIRQQASQRDVFPTTGVSGIPGKHG